jgi:hypothetical protein
MKSSPRLKQVTVALFICCPVMIQATSQSDKRQIQAENKRESLPAG